MEPTQTPHISPTEARNFHICAYSAAEFPVFLSGFDLYEGTRTVIEDSVHIEPVCGAGFVVSAAPHVGAELSGLGIIYYSRVGAADLI